MNYEKSLIKKIRELYEYDGNQVNRCFESDSEIIRDGDGFLLFSIDEFSAEDCFPDTDPVKLGSIIANASLTDIYASGGTPLWILHSLTVSPDWDEKFILALNSSMSREYRRLGISMIGGDISADITWRINTSVTGRTSKILTRKGAKPDDTLYLSGKAGGCNLSGAASNLKIPFADRLVDFSITVDTAQISLIHRFASSCIDTSDGLLQALLTISETGGHGFHLNTVPLVRSAAMIEKISGLSRYLLISGEAGEYVFLFSISPDRKNDFTSAAERLKITFYEIGTVSTDAIKLLETEDITLDFSTYDIHARDFRKRTDYIRAMNDWIKRRRSRD